jgi:ribosomal protein S18 acetylase RimI-like enzyme
MAIWSSTQATVDILDLRHYTSADLRPLLDRESEVWASGMAWDYRSSAEMILRYIDSKILPGYTAIENGRVVGYTFFVYEGTKGVIGDLFVSANGHAPDSQRDDEVRMRLLTHAIETLQQTPGVRRIEAQLLVHRSGSVAKPFTREGFRVYPRLFMQLPLKGGNAAIDSPMPVMDDIEIRNWSEADFQPAAQVITAAYFGHIDSDINDQYRTVAGSTRFLNNIVRFPGCGVFDGQSSLVAVSRVTGAMAGLLLASRVRDDVGHVTQICLTPEFRGRGLGKALMVHCCRGLRRRNFSQLTLTVTEANRPAVELYERLGFDTKRVFDAFVWEG